MRDTRQSSPVISSLIFSLRSSRARKVSRGPLASAPATSSFFWTQQPRTQLRLHRQWWPRPLPRTWETPSTRSQVRRKARGSLRNTGERGLVSLGSDERLWGRRTPGKTSGVPGPLQQSFPDPALPGPVSGKGSGRGNQHGGAGFSIHYRHVSET